MIVRALEGILEVTQIIQNFGNDALNHFNMPWGGARASNLRGKYIGLPDNTLETGTGSSIDGAFDTRNIDETGGYFIFAADTLSESSYSMGIVFVNEIKTTEFSDHTLSNIYFRNAQIGGDSNPRDYNMFTLIPKITVNPGETFYYRIYYINGTREFVHQKSQELVDFTEYGFITPSVDDSPIVKIQASELEDALSQDLNLFASPINDMIPIFLMEYTETGEQFISPDLYVGITTETYEGNTVNKPYNGTIDFIRVLGYGASENLSSSLLKVYPNPVSNQLSIELDDTSAATYTIHNRAGKALLNGTIDNGSSNVDLNNLSRGFYILNISNETGSYSRKIIKN